MRHIDHADAACKNCGFQDAMRVVDNDDDYRAEPTCLRCGLPTVASLPDMRQALARAWGLVATLRLGREETERRGRKTSVGSRE